MNGGTTRCKVAVTSTVAPLPSIPSLLGRDRSTVRILTLSQSHQIDFGGYGRHSYQNMYNYNPFDHIYGEYAYGRAGSHMSDQYLSVRNSLGFQQRALQDQRAASNVHRLRARHQAGHTHDAARVPVIVMDMETLDCEVELQVRPKIGLSQGTEDGSSMTAKERSPLRQSSSFVGSVTSDTHSINKRSYQIGSHDVSIQDLSLDSETHQGKTEQEKHDSEQDRQHQEGLDPKIEPPSSRKRR